MNARTHFAKARRQARQIRVALGQYERLIDDMESFLLSLPQSVNIRCNSTEPACLSVTLQGSNWKACFVFCIEGLAGTARPIQTKVTLFRGQSDGDLGDGQNIAPSKLRSAFRQVRKELMS